MIFFRCVLTILIFPLIVAAEEPTARVTIIASDEFGVQPEKPHVVKFLEASHNRDYARRFVGLSGDRIPYGSYTLQVDAVEFRLFKHVAVNTPVVVLVVSGPMAIFSQTRDLHLTLKVEGCSCDLIEPTWLRMIPAFDSTEVGRVCVLDREGTCVLDNVQSGAYMAFVVRGGRVLGSSIVAVDKPDGSTAVKIRWF